jgi:spore photoproduct lyase
MLDKIKKTANKFEKNMVFEIGSNSDLILENTITDNLVWTIENFKNTNKGKLTFPTKFDMVEPILNLNHNKKIIIRMSLNPKELIDKIEFGTSKLDNRIEAINKLAEADYKIGILIAPIMLVDNWENIYEDLFKYLQSKLSKKVKQKAFFELIFMTYSYIHRMINNEAFPNAINLYDAEIMTGRGKGKYTYKKSVREYAENVIVEKLKKYFPENNILYIS